MPKWSFGPPADSEQGGIGGGLIHLLIVVAIVVLVYRLVKGDIR